jgi:F420H(2)-dependent quinone reductase
MSGSERETSTEKDLSGPARLALKIGSGAHAGVYRATGGKVFGRMGKSPILLLNTVGRKTGRMRTSPLLYIMDGEDFVINRGDEFVLLEVLSEASYGRAHLPGAIRFQDVDSIPDLLPDKNTEVVAYCSNFN